MRRGSSGCVVPNHREVKTGTLSGLLKQALELELKGVSITQVEVDGAVYHRVRLGPFASRDEAIGRARAFADEGYDTLIVAR